MAKFNVGDRVYIDREQMAGLVESVMEEAKRYEVRFALVQLPVREVVEWFSEDELKFMDSKEERLKMGFTR